MTPQVLRTVATLRAHLDERRGKGEVIGIVPTMGALHEGHLSLVREAARQAREVVVTIFVNPTQFGAGEDFEHYPRRLEADAQLAGSAGATTVFAPPVGEMYPEGEQTRISVPGLSTGLCGWSRPDHFVGVATVVAKLFNAAGPGIYFFGQKDYQQWRLIEQMARDLLFPVDVVGMPTVREPDGLAMSSRNAYLSPDDRRRARAIPTALQLGLDAYQRGERDSDKIVEGARAVLSAEDLEVDYVELRDAHSLGAVSAELLERPTLLAIAARLGAARLIDNIVLAPETKPLLPERGR